MILSRNFENTPYSSNLNSIYLIAILFFIWPFGAFLYALFNFYEKNSGVVIVLFTAIFGFAMVADSKAADLYRTQQIIHSFTEISLKDLTGHLKSMYSDPEGESLDIYRNIVSFIVSRFTENGKWLLFFFGLVNGFVYVKVLSLFVKEKPERNIYMYLLIISFSFVIGLDQLSGVRFCLAAYVFFFGAIKVINNQDKRYVAVAALSVLVHFSFLGVVILLLVYPLLKKFPKVVYIVLALSFLVPNLFQSYILQYSSFLGASFQSRTELYYNDTLFAQEFGVDLIWFVRLRSGLMLIFCYLMLMITRIKMTQLNYSVKVYDLFLFTLIILAFVNFTMDIPHFGYRFQFIFLMFSIFYLFKLYIENHQSYLIRNLVLFSLPFSSLMIAYSLRSILGSTPITLYFYTLPAIFFDQSAITVWTEFFS